MTEGQTFEGARHGDNTVSWGLSWRVTEHEHEPKDGARVLTGGPPYFATLTWSPLPEHPDDEPPTHVLIEVETQHSTTCALLQALAALLYPLVGVRPVDWFTDEAAP